MKFERPADFKLCNSETAKYRHMTAQYCFLPDGRTPGCGVDIASQGDRVVPWALSFDLPVRAFNEYCGGAAPKGEIHLRGNAINLPFDSNSLDFLYSSHLLEDYLDWEPVVREWARVVKPGGNLIILIPDKVLWNEAIAKGQSPNCSHKHEGSLGELSTLATTLGLTVIEERLTNQYEGDYSILGVFRK